MDTSIYGAIFSEIFKDMCHSALSKTARNVQKIIFEKFRVVQNSMELNEAPRNKIYF
jgi:hypothetical protein